MNSMEFSTQNPRTGKLIKKYQYCNETQALKSLEILSNSFLKWRKLELSQRIAFMNRISDKIIDYKNQIANTIHQEMGKDFEEAISEVNKSALSINLLSERSLEVLKKTPLNGPYLEQEISFEPLGIILGIMPWNFPLWQFIRFATPALLSGNVIILKAADITAGVGEWMEKVFTEVSSEMSLDPCFKNLHMDHQTAQKIMENPQIRGVSFTGSTQSGKTIANICGSFLKKTVLELGGSDPYIILADANLENALESCWKGRFINSGQSCIAAKRWIVEETIYETFKELLFDKALKEKTSFYLSHKRFQSQLFNQVQELIMKGAKISFFEKDLVSLQINTFSGQEAVEKLNYFLSKFLNDVSSEFPLIILEIEASQNKLIRNIELFGPVITMIRVRNEQQAIEVANDSEFGLGAAVFTQNQSKAKKIAQQELDCGFVAQNDFVRSDALIPFGGIKCSGWGRELGNFGFFEFVNIKSCVRG